MRSILSERNIVIVLFVMVLVTFALAQEDCKEMEQYYQGTQHATTSNPPLFPQTVKNELLPVEKPAFSPAVFHQD